MIKNMRLIEYMAVLADVKQVLSNYEIEKKTVMENIEKELKSIENNTALKAMVEDSMNIAEDNAFLAGLYYGTHFVTLINMPAILPDDY